MKMLFLLVLLASVSFLGLSPTSTFQTVLIVLCYLIICSVIAFDVFVYWSHIHAAMRLLAGRKRGGAVVATATASTERVQTSTINGGGKNGQSQPLVSEI
jgi:hypothetical protein